MESRFFLVCGLSPASLTHLGCQLLLWRGEQTAHVTCGSADWKSWGKSLLVLVKALIASSGEVVSQGYFLLCPSRL